MSEPIAVFVASDDAVVLNSVVRGLRSDVRAQLTQDAFEADLAVVPADLEGSSDLARSYRVQRPQGYLIGYLRSMDPELWQRAQRIGFDELISVGRIAPAVRSAIAYIGDGDFLRKVRLCAVSETAGRLGLIARVHSKEGELLLYRISGGVYCIAGECPHAGASLSDGVVEGGVLTCPAHGSQFSIDTGDRVRGPADTGTRTFRILEEYGVYYALLARDLER